MTVQDITGGHRVTITDKDGAKTFDVMDGKDGTGGSGAQVQADWAVNDPESPAYVQNRTHYEIPAFEPITWDGNMEGRFALDLSMLGYPSGQYFVKVNDFVPAIDEVAGGKILLSVGIESTITAENVDETMFPGAFVADMLVVVVHDQSALNAALGLTNGYVTNGTYFLWNNGMYVSRLTTGKITIKKIDPKFLPESETPEIVIPEGVQSDWSQNDESKPDFVKNRTHWVEYPYPPIVWDGSTNGRDSVDLSILGLGTVYKASDYMLTEDNASTSTPHIVNHDGYEWDGKFVYFADASTLAEIVPSGFAKLGEIDTDEYEDGSLISAWDSFVVVVFCVAGDFSNSLGISIPSTGTYYGRVDTDHFANVSIADLRYHHIDKKYLPPLKYKEIDDAPVVHSDVIRYSVYQRLSEEEQAKARENLNVYSKVETFTNWAIWNMLDGYITQDADVGSFLISTSFNSAWPKRIGERGFSGVRVRYFTLPNVTVIEQFAFYLCYYTSIIYLEKIEYINRVSFYGCNSLKALVLRGEKIPGLSSEAFDGSSVEKGTGYIYVPSALVEQYKSSREWSRWAERIRAIEDYTVDGTITGELDESKI